MADRRILLKLSGELLCSEGGFGVEPSAALKLAETIEKGLRGASSELGVVLGGGNYLRGATVDRGVIERSTADKMGMLATVMNAMALRDALEKAGRPAVVFSAIPVSDAVEPFDRRRSIDALEAGHVALFAGGTGHPYFTTDTTAALRALQIGATTVAKGTKVRGVFSANPETHPDAEFYSRLSFSDALSKDLRVMDAAAFSLCRDQDLPIQVFDMREPGNIERVIAGDAVGTIVHGR